MGGSHTNMYCFQTHQSPCLLLAVCALCWEDEDRADVTLWGPGTDDGLSWIWRFPRTRRLYRERSTRAGAARS